jgi:histidinol-phosphatase (PHP family)
MIEQARREYDGRLRIRKGVEVGYCPKYEAESRKWLERKDFDYVIGAIHYIDDIAFDLRRDLGIPPNVAIKKYFAEIRQAAESGLFDVIAHFDLIRDYLSADHYQLAQATELIDAAFELMVSENVCLEINSRRSVEGETYPSRELISRYVEKGGRLFSIGSDAHSVSEFGVGVVEAMKVLNNLKSGTSHVLFE